MKKSIVPIKIILLVVFGLVAYFAKSNKPKPSQVAVGNNQPTSAPVTAMSTLKDLITQGKNVNCTYTSSTTNNTVSTGSVYVSGKNIRVDYSATVEGKKTTGSMIRDDNFTYVWGAGMPQGIKMKNAAVESSATVSQGKQYFDQNAKMDYKCQPWSPSSTSFTPPANVTFTEFSLPAAQPTSSAATSGGAVNPAEGNQVACAACNNLSGDAKTACLTQLNCQ